MLKIYFGEKNGVMKGPSWFKFNYLEEWLDDPLVRDPRGFSNGKDNAGGSSFGVRI